MDDDEESIVNETPLIRPHPPSTIPNPLIVYKTPAYTFHIQVSQNGIEILRPFRIHAKLNEKLLVFDKIIDFEGCRMSAVCLDEKTLEMIQKS